MNQFGRIWLFAVSRQFLPFVTNSIVGHNSPLSSSVAAAGLMILLVLLLLDPQRAASCLALYCWRVVSHTPARPRFRLSRVLAIACPHRYRCSWVRCRATHALGNFNFDLYVHWVWPSVDKSCALAVSHVEGLLGLPFHSGLHYHVGCTAARSIISPH